MEAMSLVAKTKTTDAGREESQGGNPSLGEGQHQKLGEVPAFPQGRTQRDGERTSEGQIAKPVGGGQDAKDIGPK